LLLIIETEIIFFNRSKSTRYRHRKRAALSISSLFSSSSDESLENNPNPLIPNIIIPDSLHVNTENTNTIEVNTLYNNDLNNSYNSDDNILNSLSSSSDDNNILSDDDKCEDVEFIIARWACRNSICHSVLDDLLFSLSNCSQFKNLPKDSRTLLHTPSTSTVLKTIEGGLYYHFGVKNEIEYLFKTHKNVPSVLQLIVGVDGLPLMKNPPSQLWPILGYFSNVLVGKPKVFIIGAYYGKSKPIDCNEYMQDFVDELCTLINVGIVVNNVHIKVLLKAKLFFLQLLMSAKSNTFYLNK